MPMDEIEVFKKHLPILKATAKRERLAWEAYGVAGVGNITPEMVQERMNASAAHERALRSLSAEACLGSDRG